MANVSFYRCTRSVFDTKTSGQLVTGGLYFITDENIIIEATGDSTYTEYGGKVKIVASNAEFPTAANAIPGVLYIKGTTGKVSDGSNWSTVFDSPASISSTVTDGDSNAVSGDAVYDYIDGLTVTTGGTSSEASKIPTLNASGKLDSTFLPAIAISSYLGSKSSVSALADFTAAEEGDWAKVIGSSTASENGSYIKTDSGWERLADALDEITVDSSVSSNSSNPVSSSGIYTAIEGAKLTWNDLSGT